MPDVKNRPECDQYIHCASCIKDTGGVKGRPYTQFLEVGYRFMNDETFMIINCKVHDQLITRVKVEVQNIPHGKDCGCNE